MPKKLVTIGVINWNNYKLTRDCIKSIRKNTIYPNYEIFLVDNGSADGSFEKLKKDFPFMRTAKNDSNKGFSFAVNQAYRDGRGFYIAHMNNDAVVMKGWLEEAIKVLESDNKIAVVGVREVNRKEFSDSKALEKIRSEPNVEKMTLPVAWITSKEKIKKVGYLDAEYFSPIYGEEADWNFRARKMGLKVIRASKSIVFHGGSVDTKKAFGRKKYLVLMNYHRLRSMLFNLSVLELLRFVPGLGLIVFNSIKDGSFLEILESYWLNLKDLKLILKQRGKGRAYVPFKEPTFTVIK